MICQTVPIRENARLECYLISPSPEYAQQGPRPAVLVLPGGAYLCTSDREAEFVALRFAANGYHAFVLRYSVGPAARFPAPMLEGFAALAELRARAEEWNVDPARIAVCGFSAGGHLAACLMTLWREPRIAGALGADPARLRPDAAILSYPVVRIPWHAEPYETGVPFAARKPVLAKLAAQFGSTDTTLLELCALDRDGLLALDTRRALNALLIGDPDAPAEAYRPYDADRLIDSQTPPAFVWTTGGDETVPPEQALDFARAMRRAGRPVELHLFGHGQHGLSLANAQTEGIPPVADPDIAAWFELALAWLRRTLG